MAEAAKVTSLDALVRFRAGLADFAEKAGLALSSAEHDVQRTIWWLQHDQVAHWTRAIKKWDKLLAEAKAELASAELQARDLRPSLVAQQKLVRKCQMGLEESRTKLQRTKHWSRALERDYMIFKAALASLGGRVDREMPMAHIRLGKLIAHLEKYVKMSPTTPRSKKEPDAPAEEEKPS